MLNHQPHGLGGRRGPTLGRVEVAPVQDPVDPELEEWSGPLDCRSQPVGVAAGQVTGVGTRWEGGHDEPEAELLFPGVHPLGRGLSGAVGVKGQHHPLGETAHEPGVAGGQRRPAGGHRPFDSREVAADHIGVALAHHQLIGPAGFGLGPVQAVEDV